MNVFGFRVTMHGCWGCKVSLGVWVLMGLHINFGGYCWEIYIDAIVQ